MDGPNVKWNVLELLQQERAKEERPEIVNIGSCGLHIVHGAFKTGIQTSERNIVKILKAIWQIFHLRAEKPTFEFAKVTSSRYSMKFSYRKKCSVTSS